MDINDVYLAWSDRLRKNQSGYISNDEFNRIVNAGSRDLYFVHFRQYEINQSVPDALRPFVKEVVLPVVNGICAFPDDYRHRIELYGVTWDGTSYIDTLTTYLEGNEWGQTLSSPIRKPSFEKHVFCHTMGEGGFKMAPSTLTRAKMRYLKNPELANRAITVANDNEEYDSANSTALEWPDACFEQLIEAMLSYSGIALRDPLLIQYMPQHDQSLNQKMV